MMSRGSPLNSLCELSVNTLMDDNQVSGARGDLTVDKVAKDNDRPPVALNTALIDSHPYITLSTYDLTHCKWQNPRTFFQKILYPNPVVRESVLGTQQVH